MLERVSVPDMCSTWGCQLLQVSICFLVNGIIFSKHCNDFVEEEQNVQFLLHLEDYLFHINKGKKRRTLLGHQVK